MKKLLSLFTALLLCTAMWGANVIKPGTYSGKWTQHSIGQLDGKVRTATEVIVSEENDGKQTITFKGYKVGFTGDVSADIKIEVTTSNGACTIAKDTETGHTNATYGMMYIRTYANYTSSINPQSMMITLCAHYYYIKESKEVVLQGYDNNYEYIQLNPEEWTEWTDFPETGKNTAKWTFNENNAFASLIDESCTVTLQSRENVANSLLKQILVKGFKMNATSPNCIATDLVLNWDTETNEITMASSGLGFYESTAKQARGKITSTGEFDFATGKFTLPVEYVYAGTWKSAVQETLMLSDIVPLESISITPKYLLEGNSVTYTATIKPTNATFSNLIWTIDNPEVATIDRNATDPLKATVTKVKDGSATITTSLGSVSTTAEIYVGNYGDWKDYQFDEHPAYGVWKMNSMYTTPQEIPNQQIQVSSFSADEHFKKIKILNFGAGLLSNKGVPVEMKWDTYDNIVTIAKQKTGKTIIIGDYTSPIYIADNSYLSGGVNTSSFDDENQIFSITAAYFYYETKGATSARVYTRKTDTLQLKPIKVSRDNTDSHKKYIVPVAGGTAYFEGTEASKAYQMMFKLEGTDFDSASWVVTTPNWVNVTSEGVKQYTDYIGIKFQVADSTLTPRIDTIKVEVYGYTFKMPISQAAPTLTPDSGMDNEQTFTFLPIGDDTLQINGNKKAKIYLNSEVKLNNNITVVSKHGLTKIDKGYGSDPNYFIRLTLTRKQCIQEDAKDTVIVYFTDNPEIRYEYYITQAGTGKLTTSHDYRTLIFGPKANRRGRFVDESENLTRTNSIFIRADIPVGKINWQSDLAKENRFYDLEMSIKNSGTEEEYLQIFPKTISNTNTQLEDNVYFFIPGVDTVTLHLIQEAKARVWQFAADQLTTLEVGNKGGKAYFKGYKNTEMILISNTPIEENEVNVTCADWITPNSVINASKDTVRITFTVDEYAGNESRTDSMKITVQGNEFILPLTQKVFSIEWTLSGGGSELVIPVEGGKTTFLNILGTEPYREGLLQITIPDGVNITDRKTEIISTGQQRTICKFEKEGVVTEDWQDTIFLALDTINQDAGFEYHFKDTIIITQAAAKVWLADDQQPLEIAAEGGASNEFTIWSNMNIPSKDWTVTQKPEWLGKISEVSTGQKGGSYYLTLKTSAAANTGTEKREGIITIKHNTLTNPVEINVSQAAPAPEPTAYIRTVTSGNWGTICLPYAAESFTGAEMYSIAGKIEGDAGIYLDQVNTMEAGVPYIFKATDTQIEVVYAAAEPQEAKSVNGLCGYIGDDDLPVLENAGNYIVYDNVLYYVNSENVTIASNRAYIKYNEVGTTPSPAPHVRRVAMPISGAPTSMLQVNGTKQPVKILRDGHIVILRADKEYDILGQSK